MNGRRFQAFLKDGSNTGRLPRLFLVRSRVRGRLWTIGPMGLAEARASAKESSRDGPLYREGRVTWLVELRPTRLPGKWYAGKKKR